MRRVAIAVVLAACGVGCGGAVIEPGHRGLLFDPSHGGLRHEILVPGYHRVGGGRIDDFDVTYSTRTEPLHVLTVEGLQIDVRLSVIFRPIIAELYELDTEIGPRYYDEVIGPEARAGARACFARYSIMALAGVDEKLENRIEEEVRRRVVGRHVEVAAVTFESVELPPELVVAIRDRQVAEQNALREKLETERAWAREKTELEHNVERRRLEREAAGSR
jgi:regulator of protease activity HflC (stomatin/prohibitin superfamily)